MKLVKYANTKNSEVDWLGYIPNNWNVVRVKDVVLSDLYGTSESTVDTGKYEILGMGDIQNGVISYPKKNFLDSIPDELLLKQDDLLFTRTNGSIDLIGKVGLIKEKIQNVSFASYLVRLRLNKDEVPTFYNYMLNSASFKGKAKSIAITTAQNNLSSSKYLQILIPLINSAEKNNIVRYLDTNTLRIDHEISLLEQKILKYHELKQILINEAVLRGLDKGVKLRDSEIEWIGDIPSNWEIKRLKDFIIYTIGGAVIDVSYWNEGSELTYTAGKNPVMSNFDNFPDRKRTKSNDILIARNGDGFIHIPKLNSIFTNVVQLVRLNQKVDVRFIRYSLENVKFHINKTSNGDFIASLNKEMWFNSFIIFPKLEEQVEISNYLDEKTSKIDEIVKTLGTKIDTLKEFRKTLINDVVTGKVKVA